MATAKQKCCSFRAGDTVLTCYGAGVIVDVIPADDLFCSDDRYSVRLWRIPYRSVGSSALARLQPSAILSHLPVVPGMLTYLEPPGIESKDSAFSSPKLVLVHCYYQNRGTFLVTEVEQDRTRGTMNSLLFRSGSVSAVPLSPSALSLHYFEVKPDQLSSVAPSAKFYPILESLMLRADLAASLTGRILRSDTTKHIFNTTEKVLKDNFDKISDATTARIALESTNSAEGLEFMFKKAAPQAEESLKQVLAMIKDDEITVLLQKCKRRLVQLSSMDLSVATRQALEKTGIFVQTEDGNSASNLVQTIEVSRRSALVAIQDLEALVKRNDLFVARDELAQNFAATFDSLAKAAKSDRGLNEIFEAFSDKTSVWQEATGRLMATRSASLFLEGASRIQARAAVIFGQNQFQSIGEIGSKLTKSLSEGDAALARLKSIQLGEAVKLRLVKAIEVRSESLGGLDGIIAGALSTLSTQGESQNRISELLDILQRGAGTAAANAQETLITVLSSRSMYRENVLMRLEQTLCALGDQIGDDFSPEEIASVVRGEGGTAKFFGPIARRAMNQIERQLDAAETQVTDGAALAVLYRVRKITSGELTISAIMDDIVSALNDDSVVAAGESLVRQSEQVLDVIEGVTANKAVTDAIQIAEKAGVTKESFLRELEKLKMDDLLGVAEKAVTDEKTRRKLISSATDTALDFLLRILPSMPVPPFEGVRDGLVYHISNLSMEGFKVKKEDIQIELAGMRATCHQSSRKMGSVSGMENRENPHHSIQKSYSADSQSDCSGIEIDDNQRSIGATELLIIEIHNTSCVLDNAAWSFEQTYLPYLKGGGLANIKMSGGSIRLQFELRKRPVSLDSKGDNDRIWEPVLCLHDRSCSISNVELRLEGDSTLTWIVNKIATIFKSPLRDYVVSTIVKVLANRSGWILERLNKILSPYWDLILRSAQLDLENLAEATDDVIMSEVLSSDLSFVELVWRERLPLGMNLLMNDDSGLLKVVDFPRGSQARVVCERRGFDPEAFKGATIVAVNGSVYDDQEELFDALKDASRPKTIRFKLPDTEDAERLRRFIEGYKQDSSVTIEPRAFRFRKVRFQSEGELGIEFKPSIDNAGLVVKGFVEGQGGIVLAAERSGDIAIGDLLTHINDEPLLHGNGDGLSFAISMLESSAKNRPLQLTVIDTYMSRIHVDRVGEAPGIDCSGGPSELILDERLENGKRRVFIAGFSNVSGMAERSGVLIGDHLVFVNGLPVGAGCRWLDAPSAPTLKEVLKMLKKESFYPIGLTFARRQQQRVQAWKIATSDDFSDSEAETICVTADSHERLGILIDQLDNGDIIVSDFLAVAGVFQRAMARCNNERNFIGHSFEAINNEFVPSYATKDIVLNAICRSWKSNKTTQLVLCDDELKRWLFSNL